MEVKMDNENGISPNYLELEHKESGRLRKDRFKISSVLAIDDNERENFFIGSLIFGLPLFILGLGGLALIILETNPILGIFFLVASIFGIAALGYGLNYLFHVMRVYLTGRAYQVQFVDKDDNYYCYLLIDGKLVTRTFYSRKVKSQLVAIYSEHYDEVLFLFRSKSASNEVITENDKLREDINIAKCVKKRSYAKKSIPDEGSIISKENWIGLSKIYATDKKGNHLIGQCIFLVSLLFIFISLTFIINTFLSKIVSNQIVQILIVICLIILLIILIFLARVIVEMIKLVNIIKGSVLHFGKIIEVRFKDVVYGQTGDSWVVENYSFVYEFGKREKRTRSFEPCYNEEDMKKLKRLGKIPFLYNERLDIAMYFRPEFSRALINKNRKK